MKQIDLRDKFFHGILTQSSIDEEIALDKVKRILSHNKVYCLESLLKQKINLDFIPFTLNSFLNKRTEICLSTYPNGKYASVVEERNTDAFSRFTSQVFYLIFNDSILKDYQVRCGELNNEYYLTGDLEVDKYLVGIGNAGLDVNYRLNILYYFFKYYNKEISFEEFLINSGEMYKDQNNNNLFKLERLDSISEVVDDLGLTQKRYICGEEKYDFEVNDSDYYLEKAWRYKRLKRLANMYKTNLYDSNGFIILNEEQRLKEVEEMIDYVLKNLYDTEEERREYQLSRLNRTRSRIR